MSLYTKYRPHNFDEVHGQQEAIKYLRAIVDEVDVERKKIDNIPHAYIFCGGHGIGKTTLARIFARELGTTPDDTYELDAASTSRKIDDMRELIDSVYTLPILSKYKVYILDEAHALTKDSSNAFLKTLEEPPLHVIFILCTTDPDKIIPTVRSRCNIIEFKRPDIDAIVDRLKYVTFNENIKIDNQSLIQIAKHSNQSYRDSITNLEKAVHTYGKDINLDKLAEMFGCTKQELYIELFSILIKKDTNALVKLLTDSFRKLDYILFLDMMRTGIMLRQDIKNDMTNNADSELVLLVKNNANFFNSINLLFFLEKINIINITDDKLSAYIAIFGSFTEDNKK